MKKIKFMLLSLALIAVVGGALGFKARFHDSFCTAPAVDNGSGVFTCQIPGQATLSCPNPVSASTTQTPAGNLDIVCTTTPDAILGCGDAANTVTCLTTTVNIKIDNP
jgi:hypothetical protein